MKYKGYIGNVEFEAESGAFHGEVINTRDVITFQGKCLAEIEKEFQKSVNDYLEFCELRGEDPEVPTESRV